MNEGIIVDTNIRISYVFPSDICEKHVVLNTGLPCQKACRGPWRRAAVVRCVRGREEEGDRRCSSGSDGEDEAQDEGESDSEAGEQEHQIIVNELLCYAFTYIDSAAPEMVIKSNEQFYTGDEIHGAKELLWQEYGKILKTTISRRRGSVRTAAAAEADDIVLSGVMVIMNALVELPIKFCALNLRRVPRFSPEELNLQSIVNRLSVFEMHI